MLTKPTEFMTASAWYAYDKVAKGGQFEFAKPLPGYRVDHVYRDGSIADYKDTGTRRGICRSRDLRPWELARPAIEYCPGCSCGYRVVRNVWRLIYFMYLQDRKHLKRGLSIQNAGSGYGTQLRRKPSSIVLTKVHAYGTAEKSYEWGDPDGTVRTTNTRLLEVFLPTEYEGTDVPASLAQKIRDRYRVTVRRIHGTIYDYPGMRLDPKQPADWTESIQAMKADLEAVQQLHR